MDTDVLDLEIVTYFMLLCPYCEIADTKTNFLGGECIMVFEKVKAILSEQFDVEEDTITMESNIAEDLGADSLDVVDLLMSIEDEFEIEIPDSEIENVKTVGDLVKYIEANKA